jgi:predicted 3-demethylubiquinone-9 3-methyltransferase (glyoxalase superfamily)
MDNQVIVPHLWFDTQAIEAAEFYASVFPDASITHTSVLHDTPSGDCDLVSFTLWGQKFEAISAGPLFQFNPSISFIVNFDPLLFGVCDAAKTAAMETQSVIWESLCEGGKVMMPLDSYPFSKRYGWVQDRYGVSWQLILSRPEGERRTPIVPAMMFTGNNCGKAEEAVDFYLSVFEGSTLGGRRHYGPGQDPNREGDIMFSDFTIADYWIAAMDAAGEHDFTFNEAVSFMVYCKDQAELDHYWDSLNANPDGGQCGWLQDRYGVSWQIVPAIMHDMMYTGSKAQLDRMMALALTMKKFDIRTLQQAFDGA